LHQTVARLMHSGADLFAVATLSEATAVRELGPGWPVLLLSPLLPDEDKYLADCDLAATVSSAGEVARFDAVGRAAGKPIAVHLKIDTGMGRLGVAVERAAELAVEAGRNGITIVGLMTHFACADTDDPGEPESMTRDQLRRFRDVDRAVTAAGAPLRVRHAANSSGALLFPEARLDLVRTGIAIYGHGRWPDGGAPRQPGMRLVTEVAQLRTIARGASVGYGATWRAERTSRVAVLPLGYADGLPRRASGRAYAAIRGHRVPLVGVISMDIAIADVTDVPEISVGDVAVLLGRASGGASIAVAEYGAWAGLSEYEVICGMSKRVPRTYVGEPP
ncbi:MAG TPA: alanine racemase, partial [Kofleriaceae bacterium]|nr:alanine racemase [Kofleriaceae bacterium]